MKKLTKMSLEKLAKTMSVIPESDRDKYWGMYENDCFWRCVAYIRGGGSALPSEAEAAAYALDYMAGEVGGNTLAAHSLLNTGGAGMNLNEAKKYVYDDDPTGKLRGKIVYMNVGGNSWHAVVIQGKGPNGEYIFYDPSDGTSCEDSADNVNSASLYLRV